MNLDLPDEETAAPLRELDGIAEIIIAKQRNGPTGRIKLAFIKNSTRFESMAEGMSPPE